jgi:hypothetical protein
MGRRVARTPSGPREQVVRIIREGRPTGPAENSIVLVHVSRSGERQARYLSWIGYHDLDEASAAEPGSWQLVEPPKRYDAMVRWIPFGQVE